MIAGWWGKQTDAASSVSADICGYTVYKWFKIETIWSQHPFFPLPWNNNYCYTSYFLFFNKVYKNFYLFCIYLFFYCILPWLTILISFLFKFISSIFLLNHYYITIKHHVCFFYSYSHNSYFCFITDPYIINYIKLWKLARPRVYICFLFYYTELNNAP